MKKLFEYKQKRILAGEKTSLSDLATFMYSTMEVYSMHNVSMGARPYVMAKLQDTFIDNVVTLIEETAEEEHREVPDINLAASEFIQWLSDESLEGNREIPIDIERYKAQVSDSMIREWVTENYEEPESLDDDDDRDYGYDDQDQDEGR
jgi:hypothetical protein